MNSVIEEPDTTHINGATQGAALLDSMGFTKPPRFDGRQEHWVAWAFRVESFASLCGGYDYMDQARQAVATIDSTSCVGDATEVAKSLYHFLVQTVDGRALQLIHLVQRGNGLEAWRVLCLEYQPAVGGRYASMLRNILNPKQWQSSVDFRESLISWDNLVLELEQRSSEKISETLKIAIALDHAPTRIAESLRLSGPDVRDNYPAMRDAMRCLYESTREYSSTQTYTAGLMNGNDSTPMDVPAVFYGKGKKGKGKKGNDKKGTTKDDKNGKGKPTTEKFDGECG